MKFILPLICLALSFNAMAQSSTNQQSNDTLVICQHPDLAATSTFDINSYIARALKYPEDARENNIQGKVVVLFTVDTIGKIDDIRVVKSAHPLLDAEAVRVVKGMPQWRPAYFQGKPVNTRNSLPLVFKLGTERY